MKKIKKFGILSLVALIVSACSCSKVDEKTYENAVSIYQETDAIYFSRLENIEVAGNDTQIKKRVDAKYLFNSNKEVVLMDYSRTEHQTTNLGTNIGSSTMKYYYSGELKTLYTSLDGVSRYKYTGVKYNDVFNVNVSQYDELLMIVGSFAPVFKLNEVAEFSITEADDKAEVSFYAVCPSYEKCNSSSEIIEYNYVIASDGTIESIAYDIVNMDTTYSIRYTFYSYGSNNVKIQLPADLETYIEK